MKQRGIILIGIGNDLYGKLAFNAALSIKLNTPEIPVALVYTPSSIAKLKPWHMKYFDKLIECPPEYYTKPDGKVAYQRAKVFAYELSPFEETIYFDADFLWGPQRNANWLFGEVEGQIFSTMTGGFWDIPSRQDNGKYTYWGHPDTIIEYHGLQKARMIVQTQTTFMYFEKCPEVAQLFQRAQSVYDDPTAPCAAWAADKPDEYCFNVACALSDIYPGKIPYHPVYIQFVCGAMKSADMLSKYWGMSNCGHHVHPVVEKVYNELVNRYGTIAALPDRFYHVHKREKIPERKNG